MTIESNIEEFMSPLAIFFVVRERKGGFRVVAYNQLLLIVAISQPVVAENAFVTKLLTIEQAMKMAQEHGWTMVATWTALTEIIRALRGQPLLATQAKPLFTTRKQSYQRFSVIRMFKVAIQLVQESHQLASS